MVDSLNVTDSLQICSGKQSDNHYDGKVDLEARFLWRYFISLLFRHLNILFKHKINLKPTPKSKLLQVI